MECHNNPKTYNKGTKALIDSYMSDVKGELFESMNQFIGGLRAGMGYCGAKDIASLKSDAKFIKITSSGIMESHPHDVTITKEAPNYSR